LETSSSWHLNITLDCFIWLDGFVGSVGF
jgi:hypothetical protein